VETQARRFLEIFSRALRASLIDDCQLVASRPGCISCLIRFIISRCSCDLTALRSDRPKLSISSATFSTSISSNGAKA
jgi:hypothetical protein